MVRRNSEGLVSVAFAPEKNVLAVDFGMSLLDAFDRFENVGFTGPATPIVATPVDLEQDLRYAVPAREFVFGQRQAPRVEELHLVQRLVPVVKHDFKHAGVRRMGNRVRLLTPVDSGSIAGQEVPIRMNPLGTLRGE